MSSSFSSSTAAVYIFNLIVGTGALALPAAFLNAGWVLGVALLLILSFVSYVTAGWVVESMAACNGILSVDQSIKDQKISSDLSEDKREEKNYFEEEDDGDDGTYLVKTDMTGQVDVPGYGSVWSQDSSPCNLSRKLELADMADLLYNGLGRVLFSLCVVAYLLGDLAIYCTAVAKSLRDVSCTVPTNSTTTLDSPCWQASSISRSNVYRLCVTAFIVILGPFTFFNLSKTKYLQLMTTILRWTAFSAMVILAIIRLTDSSQQHGHPTLAQPGNMPEVFGVSVYAFMCHHSVPSLVTPVKNKSRIPLILGVDFVIISCFYILVCMTGIFAFDQVPDLYTLAFKPEPGSSPGIPLMVMDYFLALFPVFTLSTNFPIIAITLRNNLEAILLNLPPISRLPQSARRFMFPLLAIIPPTLIALATENVGILVTITGAYAGAGIQYVIPATLVFLARRKLAGQEKELGRSFSNPLASVFRHGAWVVLVLAWSVVAIGLVSLNFILTALK